MFLFDFCKSNRNCKLQCDIVNEFLLTTLFNTVNFNVK